MCPSTCLSAVLTPLAAAARQLQAAGPSVEHTDTGGQTPMVSEMLLHAPAETSEPRVPLWRPAVIDTVNRHTHSYFDKKANCSFSEQDRTTIPFAAAHRSPTAGAASAPPAV